MRRASWPIYFAGLTIVLLLGCQKPGPRALLDGEKLIGEGKFPEAIQRLEVATQALPGNAQAWNHLGLAYQYGGKPNEALRAYQQAVSLDRNLAALRFNLGTLHLEEGRLNEAMMELTTATVLDPNSVETWVQLGKAQLRAKRIDDAERTFANALKLDANNVEALNYQGVVQLHRRRARDAMAYFAAALRLQTNYSPAVLNQAVLYHYYIVNKTNALAKYREYLAMQPDAAGAATATEAARLLEAELHPKPVAVVTNAPIVPTNRIAAVTMTNTATNRAAAAVPTNPPAIHTNVAIVPPKVTNAPVAPKATNIAKVVDPPPTNKLATNIAVVPKPEPKVTNTPAPPKTNVVVAPVTNPPPVVALKPEPAPVETPKPEPPPVVKAEPVKPLEVVNVDDDTRFTPAKDTAEAKPEPKPVTVAAKPPEPPPQPATNKVVEAPPLIRPVQAEDKKDWLKKANPVNWFKRDKDEKEEKIVAKKPEVAPKVDLKTLPEPPPAPAPKPEPVFQRYPYRIEGMPPAGNRASAEKPFNEAFTAHQEGKLGKAMDGYREAIRLDPHFFEAHLNLGIAAAQSSDLSLALASFEDSVRLNPKSAEARYQFATALRRANYPQDSANELKALLDETPNEARAHLALANLYAQILNKPELASAHYQKVLSLAPRHPQAEQIRAWLAQH